MKAETPDRQGLGARGAARRRKYLLSGLLYCSLCGGSLIVAGKDDRKRYYCANAKEKGPSVCSGMPGVLKRDAETRILAALRDGLMTDEAIAKFKKDYAQRLKEQSKGATDRIAKRKKLMGELEKRRAHFKAAIGGGHLNPTILEGLTEAEDGIARLKAEAAEEESNVIPFPEDLGALYRHYVDDLARTLSDGDVVGRASEALRGLIDRIDVVWDPEIPRHHLDLTGNLAALLLAGGIKKAAGLSSAACSLGLVAGIGFEPMTFRL